MFLAIEARLWDLSAKDCHDSPVHSAAISPDNRWLVTGSWDHAARLWDLSAKDPAANPVVLRGHEAEVTAVAISPDSRSLITGSADNTARLSLFQVSDLIKLARITVVEIFPLTNGGFIFLARSTARPLTDLPSPDESVTQKVWRAIRSVD